MTSKHLATSMAALNKAATPAAQPITASADTGIVRMSQADRQAAFAEARKAGAEAERIRIGAILNHEAAAGRGKLAAHLAFKTSMNVEDAGAMLAASAAENTTAMGAAGASGETIDWGEIVAGVNAALSKGGVH